MKMKEIMLESLLDDLNVKYNLKDEGDEPHSIFDDIKYTYDNIENKEEFLKDIINFIKNLKSL